MIAGSHKESAGRPLVKKIMIMTAERKRHEDRLRALGIAVDLAGRSGFTKNDPRLDQMEIEKNVTTK